MIIYNDDRLERLFGAALSSDCIEEQIENLCLEKLRLEREDTTQEPAGDIQQQAKAQARYQIRKAKIQAIDSQLEELRNKLAKNYREDITKQEAT